MPRGPHPCMFYSLHFGPGMPAWKTYGAHFAWATNRSIRTDRRRIVDVVRMSTGCLCRDVYTLQLYTHDDRCAVRAVSHHPSSLPITARLRRPTVRTSSLLGGRALWALRIAPARVLCGRLMRSTSLHGREGRQMEAAAWRPPCRCS